MDWESAWESLGLSGFIENPIAVQAIGLAAVAFAAWVSLLITQRILVTGIRRFVARSETKWDDRLVDARLFTRIASIVPAVIARSGIQAIEGLDETIRELDRLRRKEKRRLEALEQRKRKSPKTEDE